MSMPNEIDLHDESGFPSDIAPTNEDTPGLAGSRGEQAVDFATLAEARSVSEEEEQQ